MTTSVIYNKIRNIEKLSIMGLLTPKDIRSEFFIISTQLAGSKFKPDYIIKKGEILIQNLFD